MSLKHILVVEDEVFLRDIYIETLTQAGHQVDAAEEGDQALQLLTENDYDLVLLDVMLPNRDGHKLLEEFRQEYGLKRNPRVVFMTNLAHDVIPLKNSKQLGVVGSITKSELTPDTFLEFVNKFLGE